MNYIVQISDTHLFGDTNRTINGANSYFNLKLVLSSISKLKNQPDLIVVTGDLSQDCTFESYQHLANLLNKTSVKYLLLPGNHDDVDIINKVFDFKWKKDSVDFSIDFKNWFIYVLDTTSYPKEAGKLTSSQLAKFQSILKGNKHKPTIVFMHHHPIEINSLWMDKMMLKEDKSFNNILKKNNDIKAVFFGHIHQVFEKKLNGILYASAPSTSFQVLPNCEMFTLDKLRPGYRIIKLEKDKVTSKVIWLD